MRAETLKSPPHFCRWLWHSATLLCDGRITCGLDDPGGEAVYGDANTTTLRAITVNDTVRLRRERLLAGELCLSIIPCTLYSPLSSPAPPPSELPTQLVVEPTIRCNLRCANPTCEHNNDPNARVRNADFLDFETYRKVIDELGPTLQVLHFYNYGEPFLHPRAAEMLAYGRWSNPTTRIEAASNGLALVREELSAAIADHVNLIHVSIGGVTEESYYSYQRRRTLAQALKGLETLVRQKMRRNPSGVKIVWRYLVFHWNDSDEEIEQARRMAREIGVDRLEFMLTAIPRSARSLRRMPGSPGFALIKDCASFAWGYETDCRLVDQGLYGKEANASLGVFQWTGRKARIQVIVRSCYLNLRMVAMSPPGVNMPTVSIRSPWEERRARVGGGRWADNELHIPPEGLNTLFTLELEVSRTWIPAREGLSTDSRELGVAVSIAS